MMMTAPEPTLWTRMPVGGWQVGIWRDADGRTLVDVADSQGTLAYRVAGARRAAPSIDAGWAGCARSPDGSTQCWALAIGHVPAGTGYTVSFEAASFELSFEGLSFTDPTQHTWHDQRTDARIGLRLTQDGLWLATAIGHYSHVRLTTRSTALRYPLCVVAE